MYVPVCLGSDLLTSSGFPSLSWYMRLNAVVVQWTGPDPLQLRMMVEPAVRAFWVWSGWRWELNRMDGGAGASGTNRKSEHLNSE